MRTLNGEKPNEIYIAPGNPLANKENVIPREEIKVLPPKSKDIPDEDPVFIYHDKIPNTHEKASAHLI